MNHISQELVTSKKELVPTSYKLTSTEIRLRVLEIAKGVGSFDPPNNMIGWYCDAYKKLGESMFKAIADACREPGVIKPKNLFGKNIKEAMDAWKIRHSNN